MQAAPSVANDAQTTGDGGFSGCLVTDVPVGRTFAAPRLDAVLQRGWHRRGPPRARYQAEGGKKSPEPSHALRQMLEELERGHGTDREAAQKEAFLEGSSGSLPASAEETEAMQANGMPGLSKAGGDHHGSVYEFFRTDSGVAGETIPSVSNPQSTASFFCPQDVRRRCMIGTAAVVISVPLATALCYVMIRRRRNRRRHASAASEARRETSRYPSRPQSRTRRPSTPESWTQRQRPPLVHGKPARPPSPRPPRPPSPMVRPPSRG
ncbi:uncharacterized protein LOC142058812 [Phalacrocorax aristotelis]|uniref:uncharacterized protein LOC142058811 n=1 Tax=Phalacrocorax aristotelis TaxID=126867 RepID=UPI003F4BF18B